MPCCHCEATERQFGEATASADLERYRRKGPDATTRAMVDAVRAREPAGATLLDVGAGVGVILLELLADGIAAATHVEAASAYIEAARAEAGRRGHGERIDFRHGDLIDLAPDLPPADVVTLDRVICCYPDLRPMIDLSAGKCRRLYALSYPRDRAAVRWVFALENGLRRLRRNPFRTFVHPADRVQRLIAEAGFTRVFERRTFVWRIELYSRAAANR